MTVSIVKLALLGVTWRITLTITNPFSQTLCSAEVLARAITIVLVAFVCEALVVTFTISEPLGNTTWGAELDVGAI